MATDSNATMYVCWNRPCVVLCPASARCAHHRHCRRPRSGQLAPDGQGSPAPTVSFAYSLAFLSLQIGEFSAKAVADALRKLPLIQKLKLEVCCCSYVAKE